MPTEPLRSAEQASLGMPARLQRLLEAMEIITVERGLEELLQHVMSAARELAGARGSAIELLSGDLSVECFLHEGIDPAAQLPPNLQVPLRAGETVIGTLYLFNPRTGEFSAEDEQLVRSLATTTATTISNARLYDEPKIQQRWLAASAEIGEVLLAESGADPLKLIGRRAYEITDADLVTVALLAPNRQEVDIRVSVGDRGEELIGRRFLLGETLSGLAIQQRRPLLIRSSRDTPERSSHLSAIVKDGPAMVVPLVGRDEVLGALSIARVAARGAFSDNDLKMAAGFANQASFALQLARARSDHQRMLLLEDRDRIARDLHDHVIQQLFAIGLSLESVAMSLPDNAAAAKKVRSKVADLDGTIRQIRTSIFQLRGPLASQTGDLRRRLLQIGAELERVYVGTGSFGSSVVSVGRIS